MQRKYQLAICEYMTIAVLRDGSEVPVTMGITENEAMLHLLGQMHELKQLGRISFFALRRWQFKGPRSWSGHWKLVSTWRYEQKVAA